MIDIVSAIAGALPSVAANYIPGFNTWFAKLEGTYKRLLMLWFLVMAVLGVWAAGCAGWGECYTWKQALEMFATAFIANQAVYLAAPKLQAVKDAEVEAWAGRQSEHDLQ